MGVRPNPVVSLLRSRKFLVALFDAVVSLVLFFSAKYLAPAYAEDVAMFVGVMQLVWVAVIASIAWEDAAEKGARGSARAYDVGFEEGQAAMRGVEEE